MSHLPLFHDHREPTHAVGLKKWHIKRAQQLSNTLYECGDDIAYWCERLQYEVYELEAEVMPDGLKAALSDGIILLRKGLPYWEQLISIAHEIFHHEYHGATTAFRELHDAEDQREECQAESFALLVAEPSLWKYDSMQEFYYSSPLPNEYKRFREELFYKSMV